MTVAIADEFTSRLLHDAGLRRGMRVLDVGCGQGVVTRLAAALVGDDGDVVGVDSSDAAIEAARANARDGDRNISYRNVDLIALPDDLGSFDAIIGRRVLMYIPDLVVTLRALASLLRANGIVAFQEHDPAGTPLFTRDAPVHGRLHQMFWATVARENPDGRKGLDMPDAFGQAGIEVTRILCDANVIARGQTPDLPFIARSMAGRIEATGVATRQELALDNLPALLAREREEAGPIIWEHVVGIIGRKTEQ